MRWLAPCFLVASTFALGCPGDDGEPAAESDGSSGATDTGGATSTGPADSTTAALDEGSGSSSETGGTTELPEPLPPLDGVPTTVDEVIVPTHAIEPTPVSDPRVPAERAQLLEDGYGDYDIDPGEAIVPVVPDDLPVPRPGPGATLLSRFVHLADTQIADDESPTRVVDVDSAFISGGFRPQEDYGCGITNAAVRTINAVHAETPLDFVVLGGDNADSGQTNEVQWFLDILDGAPVVHCDSGEDNDPEKGPGNDSKDPFAPVGLDVPWLWVTGNHDVLVQGNFAIEDSLEDVVGSNLPPGSSTRDWSQPGGPSFLGPVVADERRALLSSPELLAMVAASGDGHGITQEVVDSGRANYAWDIPDTDLRFIVVDTAALQGSSQGLITETIVEATLRPLLDDAEADGRLVFIATHHASGSLSDGGGLGAEPAPDALEPADWQAFLGEYDNVLAHFCGHSHVHRASYIEPIGGSPYWEIITAAIADWPNQMRIVEVHDQDNGWLTITGVALDFSTIDDPLGEQGRALGILDYAAGWTPDGAGMFTDRNVQLWIPSPGA